MRVYSRHELELYLFNAEEAAIERTAALVRDSGGTDDEVAAVVELERQEWALTRARILATADRTRIDAEAAAHEVQ